MGAWVWWLCDIAAVMARMHQAPRIATPSNCLIFHTAVDITKVANDLIDEGWEVDPVDLATVTPYMTSMTRRFGTWHLDMEPPENEAVGRLRMAT